MPAAVKGATGETDARGMNGARPTGAIGKPLHEVGKRTCRTRGIGPRGAHGRTAWAAGTD